MTELIGVDGCRAGWVVAVSDSALGTLRFSVESTLESIIARAGGGGARVAIDIPIGLADGEPRACDLAARRMLGRWRQSSVFPAPCRATLAAHTYAEACRLNWEASGRSVSRQLFGILPRIREVDSLLTPELQERVREVHPEVTFALLRGTGRGLLHHKRSTEGKTERLGLLLGLVPPFDPSAVRERLGRSLVAVDDVLDSVACLVTAARVEQGTTVVLPEMPERDSRGLRMEIVA